MGAVFRATDTRLGRAVALKTCLEEFSERFQREARVIASLNHPHICFLYDVGPNYLVMELLQGETLAARQPWPTQSWGFGLTHCKPMPIQALPISASSHPRARRQSLVIVPSDTFSNAAVSSMLNPPK